MSEDLQAVLEGLVALQRGEALGPRLMVLNLDAELSPYPGKVIQIEITGFLQFR